MLPIATPQRTRRLVIAVYSIRSMPWKPAWNAPPNRPMKVARVASQIRTVSSGLAWMATVSTSTVAVAGSSSSALVTRAVPTRPGAREWSRAMSLVISGP